ncbi:MAG: hypothetical protein KatS3mg081_1566 [Gemmatimonadales bacterium]|nr:hypothetical protein HRbin33_00780 [bacterium HR33]GIW52211.1 MAG: hypothetical protein KatS3mg081_1566 [Gemmatimonadales bacterium]
MRSAHWLAFLLVFAGCRFGEGARAQGVREHSVPADARARTYLEAVPAELAQGISGPGGRYFEVQLRTPQIQGFPCSSCHGDRGAGSEVLVRSGHGSIDLIHPRGAARDCRTCHLPRDPAMLKLLTGETVTLDHAYRLCAQCHFAEAEAWAGGGHGKRVATWEGRRVVLNCTGCHNPHNPAFPKRLPRPGPSIPRRSR